MGRQLLAWTLYDFMTFALEGIFGIGTGSWAHSDRLDIIKSFASSCAMIVMRSLVLLLT